MPSLSTVVLTIKGDVRKANISLTDKNEITMEQLQKYAKKKDAPEMIRHIQADTKHVFIFGYKKGKKGTENKALLPASSAALTMYGDAIVIVSNHHDWKHPIPCTVDQWNNMFESSGKEDEKEEEEEEEEEEELDDVSDQESVAEDDYNKSDSDTIPDIPDIDKEEELDEIPQPIKRRRAPVYKVDPNIAKEEIQLDSPPETNKNRTACLQSFAFLKEQFSEDQIRSLEKAIFEATYEFAQKNYVVRNWNSLPFVELYKQNFRSVISNIHPDSPVKNPRLLRRVVEGEFELSAIPFMTSYEMYPEKWFELKDKLIQREQKVLEGNTSRATDEYKCRRCNKRQCTYYELQTRSADEPMTIFITCVNCGKEWRQGG